ncbi:ubiquitin carboxyl-terminal hydrolase 34-like [Anneissia japonica]|uniref:ubiquitin carboxyl-terminal hydrolase 34-like n=1 Tax=Anneissia japonica TaxID=1529436 RepID=UPI0014257091|nr:ubiquitin carboxyl-terminal hydrolase 34-like [Anneissia japonica]
MATCDSCADLYRLLQSYTVKCASGEQFDVRKKDVSVLLEFTQPQRQCNCCFKDLKNFERLNNIVQLLLRFAINSIPSFRLLTQDERASSSEKESSERESNVSVHKENEVTNVSAGEKLTEEREDTGKVKEDDGKHEVEITCPTNSETIETEGTVDIKQDEVSDDVIQEKMSSEEAMMRDAEEDAEEEMEVEVEIWGIKDYEKLLHLVAKVFQMNFALYAAHKHMCHGITEELSSQESEALGNYCEMNDLEVPIFLLRNVCFFCDSNGLSVMHNCFDGSTPEALHFGLAHGIIAVVANLRIWLHIHAVMQYVAPLRAHVIRYLCKLNDNDLRQTSARNMADMMWNMIKEPIETALHFDGDSLELAYKYFLSSTLTMRLTGLNQITSQIHLYNEICSSESITDSENVGTQLANWLLEKEIVEHIFGPNLHLEIVKQCQVILNFLAADGNITTKHIDCIWNTAQLKHSSRYVHDLLPHLIKHLEPIPLFHLLKLVSSLPPSAHTEQTLFLSQVLTKCIWGNALSTQVVTSTPHKKPQAQYPVIRRNLQGMHHAGHHSLSNSNESMNTQVSDAEQESHHFHREDEAEELLDVVGMEESTESNKLADTSKDFSTQPKKSSNKRRLIKRHRAKHRQQVLTRHSSSNESNGDDSDNIDSENEALATSPEPMDSESGESNDEQAGSEVSEFSMDIPSKLSPSVKATKERSRSDGSSVGSSKHELEEIDRLREENLSETPGIKVKRATINLDHTFRRQRLQAIRKSKPYRQKGEILSDSDNDEEEVIQKHEKLVQVVRPCMHVYPNTSDILDSDADNLIMLSSQRRSSHSEEFAGESSADVEVYDCRGFKPFPPRMRNIDILSPEDISCSSSQGSTKSEKNMADFDGEDSTGEDEFIQLNEQLHQQLHGQLTLPEIDSVYGKHTKGSCSHRSSCDDQQGPYKDFNFDVVCKKGHTLLWDLVQDHYAAQLGEGLAVEAEKMLSTLVCVFPEREIRMKFVEGCLDNLKHHRSVVVSLRLLPKLFGSFQQYRNNCNTHWITMWAEEELHMMEHFFNDLVFYTQKIRNGDKDKGLYSHATEVQVRLQFLNCVFSTLGSPDDFRLSVDQVDILWSCLATDEECSDGALNWFLNQARNKDQQHPLGLETFKHIFFNKMPLLEADTISMTGLKLFQQLCSLARLANSSYDSPAVEMPGIDQLWKIALRAKNTDVSISAIQYLNTYYINAGNGTLEKEEEFIQLCMESLASASAKLKDSQESSLLVLQRGLILLKTHLEAFKKRYSYHLRQWQLLNKGIISHEKNKVQNDTDIVRVVCQMASMSEKFTLELHLTDLVADLRAEVTYFSERLQKQREDKPRQPITSTSHGFSSLSSFLLDNHGPVRMISAGHELTSDLDEKMLKEMGFVDFQLVYVSFGAIRRERKRDTMDLPSSCLPSPPREKLPMMLLLQEPHFSCLLNLLQQLEDMKCDSQDEQNKQEYMTRAQVLSRNVWDLLMLLPTSADMLNKFKNIKLTAKEEDTNRRLSEGSVQSSVNWSELLDESKLHKLLYSLQIIETLGQPSKGSKRSKSVAAIGRTDISQQAGTSDLGDVQHSKSDSCLYSTDTEEEGKDVWSSMFIKTGGLKHLFSIFMSGHLEPKEGQQWTLWQQDCLAIVLKLINEFALDQVTLEVGQDDVFDSLSEFDSPPKKPRSGRSKPFQDEKKSVKRLSHELLAMMTQDGVLTKLMDVLYQAAASRETGQVQSGYWVVHYAMMLLKSWGMSNPSVKGHLVKSPNFDQWLLRMVLKTPERYVRNEVRTGLFELCEGNKEPCQKFIWSLLSTLLNFLPVAQEIKPKKFDDEYDNPGPGCRDYFWLLCALMDNVRRPDDDDEYEKMIIKINSIIEHIAEALISREIYEDRHNTDEDKTLTGLLKLSTSALKHDPPFKFSKEGQVFLNNVFDCLFAVPSIDNRNLPKCKSREARHAAFDLLVKLADSCQDNYTILHKRMLNQHRPGSHIPYPWQYWPLDDGRSPCGYVGLTNLGATCYMASCMQQLFMMPEARAPILNGKINEHTKHKNTLYELQRMFTFLQESERKTYNPRSFCKVYTMDKQPLNTGEQKDMTEFFTDLISKMEEMTPELRELVHSLFKGELTNNVVSLDCPHVSRTTEEFFTVRCQVADMKNLYESLDEVTVKDTLEGDNMYTCSQCGKKVRAEKRACFKKLPKILSFNTMRYTFNMVTMMKEKVNTHFSFPVQLDMSGYTEDALMGNKPQGQEDNLDYLYGLVGVTVHTGTADGGHYYSFIKDRIHSDAQRDRWYMFNDAEVKPFDSTQLAAECFGGEMTTKTYDSVTDKYMDFSFEKTHSAYMLFYEKIEPEESKKKAASVLDQVQLSKDLAQSIWQDNMQFLRDRFIFDRQYMDFMWKVCHPLPSTLPQPQSFQPMSSKLTTCFVLETLIHAKEKPIMVQWMELMTKQFHTCAEACEWFLDFMAKDDCWPMQILIKCPIQTVRQLFQRLCIHVIPQLRDKHAPLYIHADVDSDEDGYIAPTHIGNCSCVTRFIKKLLSIIEHGVRPHCKHLTEYFSLLFDFAKIGEAESAFLLSIEAITIMANFYLGTKSAEYVEVLSDDDNDEDDDDDDVISLTEDKYRPISFEKMIALMAYLVEQSRRDRQLTLSQSDYAVLVGGKGYPFLYQQIRDNINIQQTRNLIFSLTRFSPRLPEQIVAMIFNAIAKLNQEAGQPFFKLLSMLVDMVGGPPGLPAFTPLILQRMWEIAEYNPHQVLDWLAAHVPRNKYAHHWTLQGIETWIEHFLLEHHNARVRSSAAYLLVSLVPDTQFRQGYRSSRSMHNPQKELVLTTEALEVLHEVYRVLLELLRIARQFADASVHGTAKLVSFFSLLNYCLISKTEKQMFSPYFEDLWNIYLPKLSEPPISCNHNKEALLIFWYNVCKDCPENVQLIVSNLVVTKHLPYNYILADHEDQEVVMFNRVMLPAYYGLLTLCCQQSKSFTRTLACQQNLQWAFEHLTPHANQYPTVVEELFKLMELFVEKRPGTTEQELQQIKEFKRQTLHMYLKCLEKNSCWTTIISVFRILVENKEDHLLVIQNHGLSRLYDAFNTVHLMYHEATACHVTGDLVELLSIILLVLKCAKAHSDDNEICQSLIMWQERLEFGQKLLTLLNSYTPDSVRTKAISILTQLLMLYPKECVKELGLIIHHAHNQFQRTTMPVPTGPFFPFRAPKPAFNKAGIRPPRPELQMFLHASQLETSKGTDVVYDNRLLDFFLPYHVFIDLLCRTAVAENMLSETIIKLSALVALEGVPLQLSWFANFWKTIYVTEDVDKDCKETLCNYHVFHEFMESVLLDERTSFNNPIINSFFCMFFPKVYKHVLCNNWDNLVNTVAAALIAEMDDINKYKAKQLNMVAYTLNGDLRALLLMFSVSPPRHLSSVFVPALKHILARCKQYQLERADQLEAQKDHKESKTDTHSKNSTTDSKDQSELPESDSNLKKRKAEDELESTDEKSISPNDSTKKQRVDTGLMENDESASDDQSVSKDDKEQSSSEESSEEGTSTGLRSKSPTSADVKVPKESFKLSEVMKKAATRLQENVDILVKTIDKMLLLLDKCGLIEKESTENVDE